MKKTSLTFVVSVVAMLMVASAILNIGTVKAADSQDYSIERVSHAVTVLYNGYVFINDTVQILGTSTDSAATIGSFRIGFPYKYGSHIIRSVAYNGSLNLQVNPNVPLEDHMGFYAVEVLFPQPLSVRSGVRNVFESGFIFSNTLLQRTDTLNTTRYVLDFPAVPSLTKVVSTFNASIVLPSNAVYLGGNVSDSISDFVYSESNLAAFSYRPANVIFGFTGNKIPVVDTKELSREIVINEFGGITGSDSYRITNKMQVDLGGIEVILPQNASSVAAEDQFGRKLATPILTDKKTSRYNVTFAAALETDKSTMFSVRYVLPEQVYRSNQEEGADSFVLMFPLFQNLDYYVERASATFVLPEGARLQSYENAASGFTYSLTRNVFQEVLTVAKQDVVSLDRTNVKIFYAYNSLWLAFRPALWMWALTLIGCVVAVVWRRPTAPAQVVVPSATVRLRPEYLKAFADAYEEKLKIIFESDSLEAKVEKGRIPRRRYKVQRKTLEMRLNALSRTLSEYKGKMRASGGHYSELMLQLEVAESEINEVDTSVKSIEVLHNQGDLSLEAYRKRLDDYRRRKENAEATINGILLRFREESR